MKFFTLTLTLMVCFFSAKSQSIEQLSSILFPEEFETLKDQLETDSPITFRDGYNIDSVYYFPDSFDDLAQKRFLTGHNAYCDPNLVQTYDLESGAWMYTKRTTSTFDAASNIIARLDELNDGLDFVNDFKTEYTFDAQNKVTSSISANYTNEEWIPDTKSETTYDANGNRIERLNLLYDDVLLEWIVLGKTDYYWENDNLEEAFAYVYNQGLEQFDLVRKTEYFYDLATNDLDSTYLYTWNAQNESYSIYRRTTYTYQFEFFSTFVYDVYDPITNTWDLFLKIENLFNDIEQVEFQDFYFYNGLIEAYEIDGREQYFYSENLQVAVDPIESKLYQLQMSNPFTRNSAIQVNGIALDESIQFLLIDVNGRTVFECSLNDETPFTIQKELSAGSYFAMLKKNGKVVLQEKLVKGF